MKKIPDGLIASQSLKGLAVFSVNEEQNLGVIRDVLVDGEKKLLFLVEDKEWFKGGKVLRASDVTKIGKDALIIDGINKLMTFGDPKIGCDVNKCACFRKKMVVKGSQQLGKIKEYAIDRNKLQIADIEVVTDEGDDNRAYFSIEEVAHITDDTVVLKETAQDKQAEQANGEEVDESQGLIVEDEEQVPTAGNGEVKEEARAEEKQQQEAEKVTTTGRVHPEKATGRREALSKKAPNGNGEGEEEEATVREPTLAHKDLKQILEERQDKFLMGKKVDRDITADDGTIIIKKGETIDKEVLEDAKGAHKYIVLSFCIKTDLIKRS